MNRLKQVSSRCRVDSDLSDEVSKPLEEKIDQLISSGLTKIEASATAC